MRRYRDPLVVLLLIALPLVFYASNGKSPKDHNVFDKAVVFVSAPIQWMVVGVLDGVGNIWNRYIALVNVEDENRRLRLENSRLHADMAAREEDRLENQRLRLLLGLKDRAPKVRVLFGQVVATSPSPLFRSLRVDRGSSDGVHAGAAVASYDGALGRVAAVGEHHCDVMLLVDANNSVDVLVQRSRAHARVRGLGGDRALGLEVQYLSRTADVEPGDVLITSGVGKVFPKGIAVGRVLAVESRGFGLYRHAEIAPSADFERIEEVMIILSGWPADTNMEKPQTGRPQAGMTAVELTMGDGSEASQGAARPGTMAVRESARSSVP